MSVFSNYILNANYSIPDIRTVVNSVDNATYQQYESGNPLRIDYYNEDSFEHKNVKNTVETAQNIGAEVYSLYSNPFYIFHKLVQVAKIMFHQYNNIARSIMVKDTLNKVNLNSDDITNN